MKHTDGRCLLIVEDDPALSAVLCRAFTGRGYQASVAASKAAMSRLLPAQPWTHALVDLKLGDGSGLECVRALHQAAPEMRIVVLTGYPSIATAIEAVKLGAVHYLAKPAGTDEIEAAFDRTLGNAETPIARAPMSAKAWEWEHIGRTMAASGFNISEAARRLDMHRRTLARKLKRGFPAR